VGSGANSGANLRNSILSSATFKIDSFELDPSKTTSWHKACPTRDSLVDKVRKVIYILWLIRKGGKLMADANRSNEAYLGPGTKINGKLFFDGPTTIEGDVEGEITGQANVTIGQQATVKGKITAASIVVQGKVMADVQAEKKLDIQPPGSVVGDVTTQSLVIGDGAVLEGHVSMRKEGRVLPLRQEAKKEGVS
jgi:cytoskeletal protein CcmA (bactofilin family)